MRTAASGRDKTIGSTVFYASEHGHNHAKNSTPAPKAMMTDSNHLFSS
ncbi:MAG TPA: hypothetical protein H9687_02235 [Firmicutes bacterium]|nr:hypothetical protein [Bacillota bacterium]